jgi:Abnormal spindle-like microcephaly-assoc'd, ASPM-SPD-2-Hydin
MVSYRSLVPHFACAITLWVSALEISVAWQPGTSDPWAVDGFAVDRANRRDVMAFYHCVYGASEEYAAHHGWTGNAAACAAGSTSEVFQDDVLRRVNFFRALTGLPADINFTATKSAKAQKAALMMSRSGMLDHFPAISWPCYSVDGGAAAGAGNLALGSYGPAAMDGYMRDDGSNNRPVGHRRWILYSRAQEMGTGDIPAHASFSSTNTLWVIGEFKPAPAAAFSAWPNNGYFPVSLMPDRWSLSYPGADFASATVTMTVGGTTMPVTVVSRTDNGIGDNTIVWEPASLPSSLDADLACVVTVEGIGGGGPSSRTYNVTLFDPEVLGESVSIAGPASPPVTGQTYTFNAIDQADEYELQVASLDAGAWTEGAEDSPAPRIEESVAPGYGLRQTALKRTGTKAFQLTYPSGVFTDQSFVIARDIVPAAGSRLRFYDRARFSAATTTLEAQVSSNSGESWTTLFSRVGVGGNSSLWDGSWFARDIDLSAYQGQVIRVRFLMKRNGGSVFQGATDAYGFFIDDITIIGARQFANTTTTVLPAGSTSFDLGTTTAGTSLQPSAAYAMRVRPNVGCRWFEHGPVRIVNVLSSDLLPDMAVRDSAGAELIDGASSADFGSVMVGKSVTRTFTLRNTGQAALSGLAFLTAGMHKSDYLLYSPEVTSLAPGTAITIQVTFKPTVKDQRAAVLEIVSNDPDENPFRITLNGMGLPSPDIAVSWASGKNLISGKGTVGFGGVVIDKSSTQTFTVRNTGKDTLRGLIVSKVGAQSAEFTVKALGSKSLAPGARTTFRVIFKPKAKGTRKAELQIASNDPDENPFRIKLAGTGRVP